MTSKRILRFPEGFLWGTASSSHQYEGGNTKKDLFCFLLHQVELS